MTAYLPETGMHLPNDGDRNIRHFVEVFSDNDRTTLQADINAFLELLRLLPEYTPYIERIDFDTHYKTDNPRETIFNALVHYRLVGPPP